MKGQIAKGHLVGTGAAQNVSLGWYPDMVVVFDSTDGTTYDVGFLGNFVCPFSSGGTTEIEVGDQITGATSGAKARVREILLASGTWAGGDAAGFLVLDDPVTGTFGSENVYVSSDDATGTNDATVTANVTASAAIAAAVATGSGNAAITRYAGSTTAAIGFTIGSTISEEAKLLRWVAYRADQ